MYRYIGVYGGAEQIGCESAVTQAQVSIDIFATSVSRPSAENNGLRSVIRCVGGGEEQGAAVAGRRIPKSR